MVDVRLSTARVTTKRRLDEMSWPEIRAALDNGQRTVVAAAGSMEQHGQHLPLQTDALLGTFLIDAVVERLPGVLQGPTIPFGVSPHHMPFAGTISLDEGLFRDLVRQYVTSLASHGFESIFVIPTHGGNFEPLQRLEDETGGVIGGARFIPYYSTWDYIRVWHTTASEDGIPPEVAGAHAGETETSLVLAARGDLVEMDHAMSGYVGEFSDAEMQDMRQRGMTALTGNGILGDARPATADRGRRYRDAMAEFLAAWIQERMP